MPQYQPIVDGVLKDARNELGEGATDKDVANLAFKRLAVAFGKKILAIVPGRVSTEVDARLSYDTDDDHRAWPASIIAHYAQGRHRPATTSSSRSPPPGKAFAPPKCSRRKASTAT